MTYRIINESLRWYANLTKEEKEGVKSRLEETVQKEIKDLTIENIYNIYVTFMGMTKTV